MAGKLPRFERATLERVVRGEDPFCGWSGTSNSRIYSQALARLERKGLVESRVGSASYMPTEYGLRVNEENQ